MWWLLLLACISLAWTVWGDLLAPSRAKRALGFGALASMSLFVVVVLVMSLLGQLEPILMFMVWGALYALDIRGHVRQIPSYDARPRQLYFTLIPLVPAATAYFLGWPSVWWPFVLVSFVSLVLYGWFTFRKQDGLHI